MARARRGAVLAVATFLAVGLTPLSASAATTNVYSGTGYDVSYPNCTDTVPSGSSFGIVGMTGGRPFSTNGCAASEWGAAPTGPSAYFNTGYAGAYAKSITSTCSTEAPVAGVYGTLTKHALSQAENAWAIGCSEVDWARSVLSAFTTTAPAMWWADIETGNSWSLTTSLNQFTIDGISYEMQQGTSSLGGVYSTRASWAKITGSASWTPIPAPSANWVAGVTSCPSSSPFDAGSPTWLAQTSQTGGVDVDTAC
ncbi:MAG: hypothetical protein ACP5OV_07145 [Acidimicrobiales bacterium]